MSRSQTELGTSNPKQKSSALVGNQHLTDTDGTYFPLHGLVNAGDGSKDSRPM